MSLQHNFRHHPFHQSVLPLLGNSPHIALTRFNSIHTLGHSSGLTPLCHTYAPPNRFGDYRRSISHPSNRPSNSFSTVCTRS
jgi:hypothetical protein